MISMKLILLIGNTNSGKTSVMNQLVSNYGYIGISVGVLLRQRAEINDNIGICISTSVDNGLYVPNDIVYNVICDHLTKISLKHDVIIDGFPRHIDQIDLLNKLIKSLKINHITAIYIKTDIEHLLSRSTKRKYCGQCGRIFNLENINICDTCGIELYRRNDDNIDIVKNKIHLQNESIIPILEHFCNLGVLFTIDGNNTKENIYLNIIHLLCLC